MKKPRLDHLVPKKKTANVVSKILDKQIKAENPTILATPAITLTAENPLKAVNLLFPPGISSFYVERINKNQIRFLINTKEIDRLEEKARKIMEGAKNDLPN